jgi:hypothetical protein
MKMVNDIKVKLMIVCATLMMCVLTGVNVRGDTKYVNGYLYGNHSWVATNTYILDGFVYIMSNAVVNIEAGTIVRGDTGSGTSGGAANDFGCLFVCRGGKVNANGTATKPIIFTYVEDDVNDSGDLPFPTRGLWGGVVIFGNARINNAGWTTNNVSYDIYEGLPDLAVTNVVNKQVDFIHRFGGTDDNDSSGVYRYVSVRHGGKKLTTDKEINGWSMGAVGRGTTMEYLEAYCIADDGFEFFGGCVNTKYLVSAFNDDDGFDTDMGYNGNNQFWFGIQEPTAKDSGSEQNGQPQSPDVRVPGALPLATYTIRNATLIGAGTNTTANDALRFRQENKSRWYNSIFTDFGGVRVRIDDDGVSTPDLRNNLFWGYKAGSNEDYGKEYVPVNLNVVVDPMLGGISRNPDGKLDPTLKDNSPAYSVPQTDVVGFDVVNYTGAFGSVNWASGWTALSSDGFFKEQVVVPQPKSPVLSVVGTTIGLKVKFLTEVGYKYSVQSSATSYQSTGETQIVSQNVVGYVKLNLNRGYNLIGNQLNNGNNTIGSVLNVPDGTTIYKFNGKYSANSYVDGAWDLPSMTLPVGEGFFINVPSATTITLIGEVSQNNSKTLVDGVNLLSVPLPLVGGVTEVGGLNVTEGDVIYQWTGSGFSAKEFVDGEWLPSVPIVKVGEAFFLKGSGRSYVRNNSIGQNSWNVVQSGVVGTGSELSVDVFIVDSVGFIRVVVE